MILGDHMLHTFVRTALVAAAFSATLPAVAQQSPPADTDWETYVPPADGSFITWDAPPQFGLVKRLFQLAHAEGCGWAFGTGVAPEPEEYAFTFKADYDEPDDPERPFRLYKFFCSAGAYNEQAVFMAWDELEGIRTVYFARPELDIEYADEESEEVARLSVTGIAADSTLTNATYDPATRTISQTGYWRGIGDASSTGIYVFDSGDFSLVTYDVDASYDGEVNPVRVLDYSTPQVIVE
jgi:hypothetical protein